MGWVSFSSKNSDNWIVVTIYTGYNRSIFHKICHAQVYGNICLMTFDKRFKQLIKFNWLSFIFAESIFISTICYFILKIWSYRWQTFIMNLIRTHIYCQHSIAIIWTSVRYIDIRILIHRWLVMYISSCTSARPKTCVQTISKLDKNRGVSLKFWVVFCF